MVRRYRFILLGFTGGLIIWPLDAMVDSTFFYDESFENELIHPSPFELYFRTTVMAFLLALAVYAQRTTDRVLRHEERLSLALQGANDGVWDWNIESQQIYLSPRWKEMLGYQDHELPNRLESLIEQIDPDKRDKCTKSFQKLMKGEIDSVEKELRMLHKNGEWRTILCRGKLVRDPVDFKPRRVVGTHTDITERKKAEERLRHLSKAVDHAGEAILISDKGGVIEYVNPAFTQLTGYQPEEAIGQKPSLLKSDAQDPAFYNELWETITRGEVWHGSLIDRRKDGSFFPTTMTVAPIFDEKGRISHYVSTHQDMSAIKKLEEQFFEAQKMESIGTLVGGIAHDFNNMLAALMGNIYLARLEPDNRENLFKRLDSMERTGNRAAEIVRQLLTYAHKDRVEMGPVPLNSFLKEGIKLLKKSIPANIDLQLDIGKAKTIINGDTTQLQQIIINLLINARDAVEGRQKPRIACTLEHFTPSDAFIEEHPESAGKSFACLTVHDNGGGIPEKIRERIFEPFFTTKDVDKGTGLGLSMVYGAVQRHDGIIDIESDPAQGTAVRVYLPLLEEIGEAIASDNGNIKNGSGELILLVDDEDAMRSTVSEILSTMNYRVLEAANGEEALQLFNDHRQDISLVFTDIVMPVLGGIELARSIRQASPDMPVIFTSGYGDKSFTSDDLVERSVLLTKPFSVVKISQTIRRLI